MAVKRLDDHHFVISVRVSITPGHYLAHVDLLDTFGFQPLKSFSSCVHNVRDLVECDWNHIADELTTRLVNNCQKLAAAAYWIPQNALPLETNTEE